MFLGAFLPASRSLFAIPIRTQIRLTNTDPDPAEKKSIRKQIHNNADYKILFGFGSRQLLNPNRICIRKIFLSFINPQNFLKSKAFIYVFLNTNKKGRSGSRKTFQPNGELFKHEIFIFSPLREQF
jgi:hypothetical protein